MNLVTFPHRHARLPAAMMVPVAVAVAVGALGAARPTALVACSLVLSLVGLLALAKRFPAQTLAWSVFALLIAATKFRRRDPTASLAADIDSQIILELSLYGWVAAALAAVVWRTRPRLLPLGRAETLLFGYVAFAALSSLWSATPLLTLSRSIQLAILFAAAVVLVRLLSPGGVLRTLSVPLAWYVVTFAGLAAVFPGATGGRPHAEFARFSWFAVHPIAAATVAAIAALMFGLQLIHRRSELGMHRRVGLFLLVVVLLGIVLLTRSRGPLFAWTGAFMTAVLVPRLRGGSRAVLMAVVLVTAILAVNSGLILRDVLSDWSTSSGWVTSLVFRGQSADAVSGISGRLVLWAAAVPLFLQQPWIGAGYLASRDKLLHILPWAGHAHNAWVQSLLDLGLLGSALLFLAFGTIFRLATVRVHEVNSPLAHARITVLALGTFEFLSAIPNQSFAGAPGYETLLMFTCVCLAETIRRQYRLLGSRSGARRTAARLRARARRGPPVNAVTSGPAASRPAG